MNSQNKVRDFLFIWFAQLLSGVGSGVTRFALDIEVYKKTGSVTQFTLLAVFALLPGLCLSPFVGVLIDRFKKLPIILICEGSSAMVVTVALLLYINDLLSTLHAYIIVSLLSALSAFQVPAITALITLFIPERHYVRAHGLIELRESVVKTLAPMVAGVALVIFQMRGTLLLDIASYILAMLIIASIAEPLSIKTALPENRPKYREALLAGWHFIITQQGLLRLLLMFAVTNLAVGMFTILIIPMIITMHSSTALATVLSAGGLGSLAAAVAVAFWGGPANRIHGIFLFRLVVGMAIIGCGLAGSPAGIGLAFFFALGGMVVVASCNGAIWQQHVPLEMQGRVTALRRLLTWVTLPVAYLIAGPLMELIVEPWYFSAAPDWLTAVFTDEPGSDIGFLYVLLGLFHLLITAIGFSLPDIRKLHRRAVDTPLRAPVSSARS